MPPQLDDGIISAGRVLLDLFLHQIGWGANGDWQAENGGIHRLPFATTSFADLLVLLAPTLQRLRINLVKDHVPGGFIWEDEEPHHRDYSFALSHCRRLEEISLPWPLAGNGFISALGQCPRLEDITMTGLPGIASHEALCASFRRANFLAAKSYDNC